MADAAEFGVVLPHRATNRLPPDDIAEHIEELRAFGATHLLLNPVGQHLTQLDELTEIVGMLPSRADADAGVTLEGVPRPTAVMT